MAGCRLRTTAASVYCALQIGKSCRTRALQGSKEGEKKDGEKLVLFEEVSTSLQGDEWLFTEIYWTAQLFLVPDAFGGSKERMWKKRQKNETASQS